MKRLLLLAALAGCPSPVPSPDPGASLDAVRAATAAWIADPTPGTIDAVSSAAGKAVERPVGDRAYDFELARILNDVLLRPDLARARLAPHIGSLTDEERPTWLNVLLRANDLDAFVAEYERAHGQRLATDQPALRAAAAQAKIFREVDWQQAVYAHNASKHVNALPERGRKTLDLPFADFPEAIELVVELLPGRSFTFATARTTRQDEPVVALDPGAVPAMDNRRRVIGFLTSTESEPLRELAQRTIDGKHKATVSFARLIEHGDTDPTVICGEGRMIGDVYWGVSACEPFAQARWMEAASYYTDLGKAGVDKAERLRRVKERFPGAPFDR